MTAGSFKPSVPRLQTLGELTLQGVTSRRHLPLLLLAYLRLEGPTERQHIRALFWPGNASSQNNLRVMLSNLRTLLPSESFDGPVLSTLVACDAAELSQVADPLLLYRGAFLHGVRLDTLGTELQEWILQTRERLALQVQHTLLIQAEQAATPIEAARLAEQSETLPGAPPPEVELLLRMQRLALPGSAFSQRLHRELLELEGPRLRRVSTELTRTLLGREAEVNQALAWLGQERSVQVKGPAGIGKTHFTLEVLAERHTLGDEVVYLELDGLHSVAEVSAQLASRLGLHIVESGEAFASLGRALNARAVVVGLDGNAFPPGLDTALTQLLQAAPAVRVIVSGRTDLWSHRPSIALAALPLPILGDTALNLRQNPGVRLFLQTAGAALHGSDDEVHRVAALVRRLLGLPLAVQLLGRLASRLPLEALFRLLDESRPPDDSLGEYLAPLLARTWALLNGTAQAALRQLASAPVWSEEASRVVANVTPETLTELISSGLVRSTDHQVQVLPLVPRWLDSLEPRDPAVRARLNAFLLERLMTLPPNDAALDADRPAILVALRETLAAETPGDAQYALVARLSLHYEQRGLIGAGLAALSALEPFAHVPGVLRALHLHRAWLAFRSGALRDAEGLVRGILADPDDVPVRIIMQAHNVLAVVSGHQGHKALAAKHLIMAVQLAEQLGEPERAAVYRSNLALELKDLGEYAQARDMLEMAQRQHRERGQDLYALYDAVRTLQVQLEDPDMAPGLVLLAAQDVLRQVENTVPALLGAAQHLQARAALRAGDAGALLLIEALTLHLSRFPDPTLEAAARLTEAEIHYQQFRTPLARVRLAEAAALCLELGDEIGLLDVMLVVARDLWPARPRLARTLATAVANHTRSTAAQRREAAAFDPQPSDPVPLRPLLARALRYLQAD